MLETQIKVLKCSEEFVLIICESMKMDREVYPNKNDTNAKVSLLAALVLTMEF